MDRPITLKQSCTWATSTSAAAIPAWPGARSAAKRAWALAMSPRCRNKLVPQIVRASSGNSSKTNGGWRKPPILPHYDNSRRTVAAARTFRTMDWTRRPVLSNISPMFVSGPDVGDFGSARIPAITNDEAICAGDAPYFCTYRVHRAIVST